MNEVKGGISLLSGKVALITGASRGIGRCIAETFAAQGAKVFACARDVSAVERVAKGSSGEIVPVELDVTNKTQIRALVARLLKEETPVHVLVNNAGMISNQALGMISMDMVRSMFEVNVFGLLELSQLVATRFMRRRCQGSIINVTSVVAVEGSRGQVAYSASKGAVISLTKSMAKELAPYGVRVNAVAPGMVETDRLRIVIKEKYRDSNPTVGMGRLGEPRDVANACLYFASDLSSYTTGQVLVVAGGSSTDTREFYDIDFQ